MTARRNGVRRYGSVGNRGNDRTKGFYRLKRSGSEPEQFALKQLRGCRIV